MTDSPALKTLWRFERTVRRRARQSYEGHAINHPRVGDVTLCFRENGVRRSIAILPSGRMVRYGEVRP